MFKKMTKKKTSKQLTKILPKKKLYTSSCDKYEKIMTEDKIGVTKSNKDKPSAPTFNVNAPGDDKKLLKTQGKKKKYSKVNKINNLKNANAAVPSEKKNYTQIDECIVLLSDFNAHKKNNKSHKASTSNTTKNSSENDKENSSMLKSKEHNMKKKKKEDPKAKNINNLINDDAVARTKKKLYSQIDECFVLLSDFNEHKKNNKSHKASTSNNTKNSPENDKLYSSILKTLGRNTKSINKKGSKVQNINNLKNANTAVPSEKRHYSQIDECFVLLSDFNEHNKNHKSHKASTSNNIKNISEKDKDYSSILKTQGKKKKYSKVHKRNNLKNANAAVPSEKKNYTQIDECIVLLSDFNEHKKNNKSHKASTSNTTKNSSENDKENSSMLKSKVHNMKKKKKEDSKAKNINNLINDDAVARTKKKLYSQIDECFVLLSDFNEHKKNNKSHKASTSNTTKNSSENDKENSSMLKSKEHNMKKKKKEDSKVKNVNNLINDDAVACTKKILDSQIDECFVLLSDFNEHNKNHKSHKASTSNNTKVSPENGKENSSMLKSKEHNMKKKKKEDSKAKNINNLINDDAVARTKKRRYSQIDECFVLLSDFNEHNKNHKSHKASTSNDTKVSPENDKDYSSILRTRGKKIKKQNKYKVQKINNLVNDNADIHTEKRDCSQLKECFVLLSDFNEHKKIIHKPNKASTRNKTIIGSENNKEYLSIL